MKELFSKLFQIKKIVENYFKIKKIMLIKKQLFEKICNLTKLKITVFSPYLEFQNAFLGDL